MKLNTAIVTSIAYVLLAIPLFASESALPEIDVPQMPTPPIIDGKLDSSEWARAAEIPGFVDYTTGEKNLAHQTICWVGRGSDAVYVAFECKDDNTRSLVKSVTQKGGPVWSDDCVEVFLSATSDAKTYYQFCVNVNGAQYDTCGRDGGWNSYWLARTSIGKDARYAELKIPYSALRISSATTLGGAWRANFRRDYPQRSGANAETSCWSPILGAFSGFHTPGRFGLLRGMALDSRYLVLSPETGLTTPERWLIGQNSVELTLKSLSGSPCAVQVACIDPETGAVMMRRTARAAASSETKLNLPLNLPESGDYKRQYVVFDFAGAVISTSRVLDARASILDCALVSPAFRGNIQSKDPEKEILVQGAVGIAGKRSWKVVASLRPLLRKLSPPDEGATSCNATFSQAIQVGNPHWGPPIWQRSIRPAPAGTFEIKRNASDLPVGDYSLDISLLDASGKSLGSQVYPIKVMAPAPEEVTFDRNRICYINGKPFFPLGIFHVSKRALNELNNRAKQIGLPMLDIESVIKDVRDHGFNTIHNTWVMPDDDYMRMAKDAGLYVIPEVNCPPVAEFARYRKTADDFGNILFWYGFDEPIGERLRLAIEAHGQYVREDPHRPFAGAICYPEVFDSGVGAFDILIMDPYFVGSAPLSTIGEWIDRGMSATKGLKPIWVIPQAFAIDSCPSEPTPAELRCEAYICIVHGATGLIWYAYHTGEPWSKNQKGRNQWYIADTPLWPYFKTLNAELSSLTPVITTGKQLGRCAWSDESIHSAQWEYNGSRYIIAVNCADKPVGASIRGLSGKSAQVISENRKAGVDGGKLSDTFGPLEAHIYKCAGK